jgi:Cyclin, N-terminal domain
MPTQPPAIKMCQKVHRDCRPIAVSSIAGTTGSNVGTSTNHDNHHIAGSAAEVPINPPINPIWRVKVTQWCYDYIDCISERRTVVYMAMTILDRYCRAIMVLQEATAAAVATPLDHTHYQVAALAATYLAIRIAGSSSAAAAKGGSDQQEERTTMVQLSDLVAMSRGKTSQGEIVAMGTKIVKALSWDERMETPTEWVYRYCHQFRDSSTDHADTDAADEEEVRRLVETANFMVEVAIFDADLCALTPRILAAAAVLQVLPSHRVPAFLEVAPVDPKVVYVASHRLGTFVKESLRTTPLAAAQPRPDEAVAVVAPAVVAPAVVAPAVAAADAAASSPHVIEADDHSLRPFKSEQPVYINGFELIPDDYEDEDAMDES